MPAPRAVIFDFNGTLSHGSPLLIADALAGEAGVELDPAFYEAELAGLSDPEVVERALERAGHPPRGELRDRVLRAKTQAYRAEIRGGGRILPGAADFVRKLAAAVPLAIASGAFAAEIGLAIELAGIGGLFAAVVAVDDVDRGRPSPECYELALARINERRSLAHSIVARDVWAVEVSLAGVAAARAAGFACAAAGDDARVSAAADLTLPRLDGAAAERLLAG